MYKEHFGLKEQPFGLTPNTVYFLNSHGHREALNMLRVALANDEGFIKVVGEVGTGKTMLCRKLLKSIDDNYYTAYIPNPFLNPTALYRAISEELGVKSKSRDGVHEYQRNINHRLMELAGQGKKVLLVIDEAQSMPAKTLEALRLISNLETESSKLIHIVLFGQPELDRLLDHSSLRQLRQRITFSYYLPPLDLDGTRNYIRHRVATAGYNGSQLFSDQAVKRIYRASEGIPRLINILCHKAMLCAYGKGNRGIDKKHIALAVKDTDGINERSYYYQWLFGLSIVAAGSMVLATHYLVPGGLL